MLEGRHSEWDAGPPACGALGSGEGAASSGDGAFDRDRMMFARPQIPGSASPLSLCLKLDAHQMLFEPVGSRCNW
jgi:hypothetical protein